ncbi:uncharacterized protein 4933407O12Rik isoform X2 [Mus musculus]|uniref:uncharacterized protein 4933407O12Rik isoform X2 n=1 Tax=Mus musculus TaxID=10090 RepID=UPI0003D73300|nr:uncharacterized protein 4933407O12Rik isoform X2 [Mus musculus]|eukprot:XP_006525311.1 PREDICTED: uncharacterized protein LOC102635879 isoform X2 [Mus musculus]
MGPGRGFRSSLLPDPLPAAQAEPPPRLDCRRAGWDPGPESFRPLAELPPPIGRAKVDLASNWLEELLVRIPAWTLAGLRSGPCNARCARFRSGCSPVAVSAVRPWPPLRYRMRETWRIFKKMRETWRISAHLTTHSPRKRVDSAPLTKQNNR